MYYPDPVVIHAALVRMRDVPSSRSPKHGICSNLSTLIYEMNGAQSPRQARQSHDWIEAMFKLWPGWNGDLAYPVDGYHEYTEGQRYGTIFDNPVLMELLDFLIEKARMQANEPEAKPRFL